MLNDISRTEKERQVLYDITYLESKQYNKLMSVTNRSKFTNKQPISGYQWRSNIRIVDREVQTIRCKIGPSIYCIIWGIEPIFCNDHKWKVTFKNYMKY